MMVTINSFSLLLGQVLSLLCISYTGFLVLLNIRISVSQGNEIKLSPKPIEATVIIDCPECNNSRPCNIIVNGVSTSRYTLLDNGSLIVPANDIAVYGTLRCGGSSEQLTTYIICPLQPENGQSYDWISISSSETVTTVGKEIKFSLSFPHLPHSGISTIVDGKVSGDDDMSCSEITGIMNTTVNSTCTAIRPSVNNVTAEVTFCDIDFVAQPLIITITEPQPDVSMSSSPVTSSVMLSNVTASATAISSSATPTFSPNSTVSKDESLSVTPSDAMETGIPHGNDNDDGGSDGGVIAAVVISAVVLVVIVIIVAAFVYCIWFRTNSNSSSTSTAVNIVLSIPNGNVSHPIGTDNTNHPTDADNTNHPTGADNTNHPTDADNTNHPTGADNTNQSTGADNTNGVCIRDDGPLANIEHPVQPDQENDDDDDDDDDVRSITPEDEAPIVNVIDEANTAGTCNELECTSNGVSQDNAALLLNIMTTQRNANQSMAS